MSGAGKGDSPRNCFSKRYKNNYDLIKWTDKKNTESQKKEKKQWTEQEKSMTKMISKEGDNKKEII